MNKRSTWQKFSNILAILMGVVAVGAVLTFHYYDAMKPIPEFDSLKVIAADDLKYERVKAQKAYQFRLVFKDEEGNSYESHYLPLYELEEMEGELEAGGVKLWVGERETITFRDDEFSIYHMATEFRVLIDYEERVSQKEKEQKAAIPIMILMIVIVIAVVVVIFLRRK